MNTFFLSPSLRRLLEISLPLLTLAVSATFTVGLFQALPYAGFEFQAASGTITDVFVNSPGDGGLQRGDKIVEIGAVSWVEFQNDYGKAFFERVQPGQVVIIDVLRAGQPKEIAWRFPGKTPAETNFRLQSEWVLAYPFWLAGLLTFLVLRPKDTRWKLLLAFDFLTSIWLAGGSLASHWHLWRYPILTRSAIWMTVPVLVQLHWTFPVALKRLPPIVPPIAYLAFGLVAAAEWLQIVPHDAYTWGFLSATLASLALIAFRLVSRPDQRRAMALLLVTVSAAIVPAIAVSIASLLGPVQLAGTWLLVFPVLPWAYLLVAYIYRTRGLEFRANRLAALYFFLVALAVSTILALPAAGALLGLPGLLTPVNVIAAMAAAIIAVFGFGPFQRWVEYRLLGIPHSQAHLGPRFRTLIVSRLEMLQLLDVLRREVLPTLVIRQAALLRFDDAGGLTRLLAEGVEEGQLPSQADIPVLLDEAGRYRPLPKPHQPMTCPWVRLVLPLVIDEKTIGLWLLGRHDPDDYYSRAEIEFLRVLADYLAVALAHLQQTERLHSLNQANVIRQEAERAALARDLHDQVLNGLAALNIATDDTPPEFRHALEGYMARLRKTIGELRPPLLDYGLTTGLEALADDLADRGGTSTLVLVHVSADGEAYPADVQQHIYRIVQQAAENVLRHARAATLHIKGRLDPEGIDVAVEDDGVGFAAGECLDMSQLLAQGRFGLAGMLERAALINAQVNIHSKPGSGTRVQVLWRASSRKSD
jgi:signal transduction histidine kinase